MYDPLTGTQDGSGQNRTPFAGNIIPTNRINPVSLKLLAYLPPTNENFNPTSQTNDYFALLPARNSSTPSCRSSRARPSPITPAYTCSAVSRVRCEKTLPSTIMFGP